MTNTGITEAARLSMAQGQATKVMPVLAAAGVKGGSPIPTANPEAAAPIKKGGGLDVAQLACLPKTE